MKIAIVSAYGEGEANSEYTYAIEQELLEQGHSVDIFKLPIDVFSSFSSSMRKLADQIIDEIVLKLNKYDYINFQYEAILFGYKMKDSRRRILKLISACKGKKFSVTLHRVNLNKNRKHIVRFLHLRLNHDYTVLDIVKSTMANSGKIIVHTKRDELKLKRYFPAANIVSHPLSYYSLKKINNIKSNFSKKKYIEEKGINIPEGTKIISFIGSFTFQKDVNMLIKTLNYLPDNYHLFIFGGQHKISFASYKTGYPEILEWEKIIDEFNLSKRVHFMGFQPKTEDIINANLFSDYVVLPYFECGESGSGSLGTALNLCDNIFVTRNNMSDELIKFSGNAFFTFDMGNYMELAEKIMTLPDHKIIYDSLRLYLEKYNISENLKNYYL